VTCDAARPVLDTNSTRRGGIGCFENIRNSPTELTAIVVIFAGRALLAQPHAAASERPALSSVELRQALPIEA
jgi:hypothetical protein